VKTEGLNTGRDWQELQETNDGFIVLDSNDLIVSCNDKAQKLLAHSWLRSKNSTPDVLPIDCFWLDTEQRPYHASEFKNIVGKTITLLFKLTHCDAYKVKVFVESFYLFDQQYYSLFIKEDPLDSDVVNRRESSLMLQALSADLRHNKLELHYQPQINISNNSLYGVEVLARWNSEAFGQVAPDDFIALAEEFGLIAELDLWVLRRACQQLAAWREKNICVPILAVNFSPFSFHYPDLKNVIQSILQQNGILASNLVLEITESKQIKSPDSFANIIHDLHLMGIAISLDDFGTDYSNLKRLLKFPVSQLKLDRSFVSELPNKLSKELSEVVFSICQKIDAVPVAEGVETQQQLSYLSTIGYQVIQGYLLSPPLSVLHFEEWCLKKF
jgi:EAL domain-containing protein (putative c-di-GMP-specific phosphodiesterase class I)